MKNVLIAEIPLTQPVTAPATIWDKEEAQVTQALATDDPTEFLKTFPGKPLVGPAASSLGLTKERYCELVKIGLGTSSDPAFQTLHRALEDALTPYLPPRLVGQSG
jgi:hypothetical protein